MNAAWANDDEETVVRITAMEEVSSFVSACDNCGLGIFCLRDFGLEEVGRSERVVATD